MKYDFQITHVTGKTKVIPDALSRAPISFDVTSDYKLIIEINEVANTAFTDIPISHEKLAWVKHEQEIDPVCKLIPDYCQNEWSNVANLLPALKPYYNYQDKDPRVVYYCIKRSQDSSFVTAS